MTDFTQVTFADISKPNRPTLGNLMPIVVYRLIRSVAMEEVLGETAGPALYAAGKSAAASLSITSLEDFAKLITDLKIGIPKVLAQTERKLTIQVDECATCSGMPNIGRPFCHFEGGLIAGAVEKITGKKAEATETKCWGLGDGTCVFEVMLF